MSSTRDLVVLGAELTRQGYEWDLSAQRGEPFRLNVYTEGKHASRPNWPNLRIVWSGSSVSLPELARDLEHWLTQHGKGAP